MGRGTSDAAQGEDLSEEISGLMEVNETVSQWRFHCTQFNLVVTCISVLFLTK